MKMADNLRFDGKVAIVTGAGGGLNFQGHPYEPKFLTFSGYFTENLVIRAGIFRRYGPHSSIIQSFTLNGFLPAVGVYLLPQI